jgi:LPXTG-motif cell wall-anchored protein
MYVGEIHAASATVDKIAATMINGSASTADTSSANAIVKMSVVNNKGFLLPQTGGRGLYAVTILGVIAVGCGCYSMSRKKRKAA